MKLYELVNPSDHITYYAKNDQVAYLCAVLLSGGFNAEPIGGEAIGPFLMFAGKNEKEKAIKDILGGDIDKFLKENRSHIAEAYRSFAYLNPEERRMYDEALKSITDPDKLAEFKKNHEDRQRTSMSPIVKSAWSYADSIEAKAKWTTTNKKPMHGTMVVVFDGLKKTTF